ncbi:isoaspartyl peptidase/L-asparaginase family protein [Caulobacter segnis]|uniref:isoaspartyl peptidase/L-asparaginase family protein n=1 Tax=Caulobacter segnis TaxID=88688 RepID=UPI0024106E76|nr:isoaspartyl peptidase/L-asparaginase family protein [Caulobacter segnis]MDG2520361.1 isoaspartyl peptidase/L-asparaginase family protein [Caulobacter segnis]
MPEIDTGRWAIIVHGGAKDIPPQLEARHRQGCLMAVEAGVRILTEGGSAIQAAQAAVRVLEDDPVFNAGHGSVKNADGDIECDAAIMDGSDLSVGAVAAVRRIRNPIDAAVALLSDKTVLLVAEGAERFARARGVALCEPKDLQAVPQACDAGCDTVGCVVIDGYGDVAAATSTGGLDGARPGRVGDSPLPGCGLSAENGVGGVSLSGEGEAIIRTGMAHCLMRALEFNTPGDAAKAAFERLARVGAEAGAIVIDAEGRIDWMHNSRDFAVGYARHDMAARAFTRREQDPGETA